MKKILVVDDDATIVELMKRILERDGYEVVAASTGEECLKILDRDVPATIKMVFLDLKMPGMGGEKTLAGIRRRNKRLPVVIVSGYGTFDEKVRLFKKEARRFIAKPFNIDFIRTLARNTVNGSAEK